MDVGAHYTQKTSYRRRYMSYFNFDPQTLVLSIVGGFLPPLLWLIFWLKEDEAPEPRKFLVLAFFGGILAIPAALLLELFWSQGIHKWFGNAESLTMGGFLLITGFAFIEEYAKYFFVHALIFWRDAYNEPADAMIYLMTGALGFAATENVLYLIKPFDSAFLQGFTTTDLRFLGPTLLHSLSSGFLGFFIARAFFQTHFRKEIALFIGLLFSTGLHVLFNIFILVAGGKTIEHALALLVVMGIVILFSFEKIKHTIKKDYAQG